ncbi:MAG TPA: EamA family transporter [Cellulomonadaceae bacterium]|nr:EamA family transporter [Cellulomonadaceae bacterium]
MPARDRLLALLVAVLWGLNFPAIHLSLAQFPPFFLVALRFSLIAIPVVVLVPRPVVPWRWLLGYGLGFGVLQFAFLYLAMDAGMPTGLASLVLQSSAPFTVLLGAALLGERLSVRRVVGIGLAVLGLAGIALHRADTGGRAMLVPVVLTLLGGLGWAVGNLCNRKAAADSPWRLMLWMTVVPPVPMFALSLVVDGPTSIGRSLTTLGRPAAIPALGGLLYTVLVATLAGSGIWTALMARNPSGTVAPFSMLVPVVGIAASWLVLHERPTLVDLLLGILVLGGVLAAGAGARRGAVEVSRRRRPGPWPVRPRLRHARSVPTRPSSSPTP